MCFAYHSTPLTMLCVFQEGEEGKEEEEKEKLGKLEYTLDYNFNDNQVLTCILQAYTPLSNLQKHRND